MSFLDSLKQDALVVLHATTNALHAQLANALAQAGHPVSEADHVDTLVASARSAATGAASAAAASTTAPNYADAALATFTHSMTAALIQFAQQHLPAKFQGVAADAAQTVADATTGKPPVAAVAEGVLKVTAAAASVAVPSAAPFIAIAEPLVEEVVAGFAASAEAAAQASSEPVQAPATVVGAMNTQGV